MRRRQRQLWLLLMLLPFLLLPDAAAAQGDPPALRFDTIGVMHVPLPKRKNASKFSVSPEKKSLFQPAQLADLCLLVKEAMSPGVFKQVSCNAAPKATELLTSQWRILVSEVSTSALTIQPALIVPNGKSVQVKTWSRPIKLDIRTLPKALKNLAFRQSVSAALRASFPVERFVTADQVAATPTTTPAAPQATLLYTLSMDPIAGVWQPTFAGRYWPKSADAAGRAPIDEKALVLVGKTPLVTLNSANSKSFDAALTAIEAAHDEVTKDERPNLLSKATSLLADQFAGGFVAVRYGMILSRDDPLLSKAVLVGVLGEFRSGFFDGVRVYYDLVPQVSIPHPDGNLKYGWNRVLLGWGFELPTPSFIDSIEIVPKIGRWYFNARIPVTDADGAEVVRPFNLTGALSFGAELSVEKAVSWFFVRGWAGQDFARANYIPGLQSQVSSLRLGLDAVFKGATVRLFERDYNLTYLAFVLQDRFLIEGTRQADEERRNYSVNVKSPYAGAGIGLAW